MRENKIGRLPLGVLWWINGFDLEMRLFPCMYLCVCLSPPLPCVQSCCLSTYTHARLTPFSSLFPTACEAFSSFCVRHAKWRGQLFLAAAHPNKTVSVDAEHWCQPRPYTSWHCIFPVNNKSLFPPATSLPLPFSFLPPLVMLVQLTTCLGKLLQILLRRGRFGFIEVGNTPVLTWALSTQAVVLWKESFYFWLFVYIRICCFLVWIFQAFLSLESWISDDVNMLQDKICK